MMSTSPDSVADVGTSCVLHLSDLHFGTEVDEVVDALGRLSDSLDPDCLLVSGDLTQRARTSQFRDARRFLERLGVDPMLVVPGNHDIPLWNLPARLLAPYRGYRDTFPDSLEPVLATSAVSVCGINTTRRYRHVNGEVSGRQVEAIQRHFASLAGDDCRLRIVAIHHPAETFLAKDREDELIDNERLLDACLQCGVDLIVGGHIHRPYQYRVARELAGQTRALWVVQAGTALSYRTRDNTPNSVNVIRYLPRHQHRSATLERWDYDASSGAFAVFSRSDLTLCDLPA